MRDLPFTMKHTAALIAWIEKRFMLIVNAAKLLPLFFPFLVKKNTMYFIIMTVKKIWAGLVLISH